VSSPDWISCGSEEDRCLPRACDPSHVPLNQEPLVPKWIEDRYHDDWVPWFLRWHDVQLLAWLVALALPLIGWLFAMAIMKAGPGRAQRAAAALGPAATTVGGLLVVVRLIAALPIENGLFLGENSVIQRFFGGVSVWVPTVDGASSCVAPPLPPGATVLGLACASGVALALLTPLFALGENRRIDPLRIPAGTVATVLLTLGAIAVPVLLVPALDHVSFQARLLDVAGMLPEVCIAFAIWTQARREAPPKQVEPAPPPPVVAVPALDAAAVWKRIGAIPQAAGPFLGLPAAEGAPAPHYLQNAWKAAGGLREPPHALDHLVRIAAASNGGALVADLPRGVEDTLLAATLLHVTAVEGATCLVIVDDLVRAQDGKKSSALRDRVVASVRASGYWEPGPMPLGYEELSVTLTGDRLPAIAFLDVDELSEHAITTLWGGGSGNGVSWARHLELVIVPRIDQGSPLRVAHRFWSLRRLCLALRAAGSTWSALSTGYGGDETYTLAQSAFAGYIATERIEVDLRSRDESAVWSLDPAWAQQGPDAWQVRASEPIARDGLTVAVDDPLGHVDDAAINARGPKVRLARAVTFDGAATVTQLEGAWLFAAIRSLPHRMPNPESAHHDILLAAESTPTTRFALHPRTLPALLGQRRLPAPAPLVARRNPIVQRLHLRAALAEGEQDLASLHAVFDDPQMIDEACKPLVRGAHMLRGATGRSEFDRVELVAKSGERVASHLRETVTENVVHIVELDSGREIARTDAITLETRYYSGRVFSKGARRYEVPLGAHAAGDTLRVKQVDPKRPLNRPRLAIELTTVSEEHEADLELRLESHAPGPATRIRYATLVVHARESIHGVVDDDGRIVQRYAPLRATYDTRIRHVGFRHGASSNVLLHLASAVDDVLRYTIASDREDFAVVPSSEPLPGIAIVDRQFRSAGVVEALPADRLLRVLEWVSAILAQCTCADGCPSCTAPHVLAAGADKAGVLALLGA
jgi:hypothetical protein